MKRQMLLSKLTRFPWKHNKTKIMAETAMTQVEPQQSTIPQHATPEAIATPHDLRPCNICGRTFLPQPLRKHYQICQKNATRKRRVFNSLRQRVGGTDLEPFHQRSILGRPDVAVNSAAVTPAVVRRRSDAHAHTVLAMQVKPNRWKEKHIELMNVIRAAKEMSITSSGLTIAQKSSVLSMSTGHERCPSCDRAFGIKAFDRHVEWCKEHKSRVQNSPANVQVAKDRLDARIKYRVPPLNKPKRTTIKDKYANGSGTTVKTPETPTAPSPLMTKSTTSLDTIQSCNKHRSITGVASTTALHSRSSFRLKDMAPRVVAGPRLTGGAKSGADGDRYQTTPVMVRRGGHEAVVKGTHIKDPRKLNTTEVNTSDITVSSIHVDFFKSVPKSKTMITWKDTLNASTSSESTNIIATSTRKKVNKKNCKGTNVPSRTNIITQKPLVAIAPMQNKFVTQELLAECPDVCFKANVEDIPKITKEFVEKLVPEQGPIPKIPPRFIVDNLLNVKNFSRINAFLDDSAVALSNTKNQQNFIQPESLTSLIRDISPKRRESENDLVLATHKSKLEIKENIVKTLINQSGLQPRRKQTEMIDLMATSSEELKSNAFELEETNSEESSRVRFEDTLRAFSPRPRLVHSAVNELKPNFIQSNIDNIKASAKKGQTGSPTKKNRFIKQKRKSSKKKSVHKLTITSSIVEPAINERIETNLKPETAADSDIGTNDGTLDILEYIMHSGVTCDEFILFNAEKRNVETKDTAVYGKVENTINDSTQYSMTDVYYGSLPRDKLGSNDQSTDIVKLKSIFTTSSDSKPTSANSENEIKVIYQRSLRTEEVMNQRLLTCEVDSLQSHSSGKERLLDVEELFCPTNRSNTDLESICGLASNAYSTALSTARVKQGIRNCTSEIHVTNNSFTDALRLAVVDTNLGKGSVDQCHVGQLFEPKYDLARQDEILALAGEQFLKMVEITQPMIPSDEVEKTQTDVVLNNPPLEMPRTNPVDLESMYRNEEVPEKRRKVETPSVMKINLQNNLKHIKLKKRYQKRFGKSLTSDSESKSSLNLSFQTLSSSSGQQELIEETFKPNCNLIDLSHNSIAQGFKMKEAEDDMFGIQQQTEKYKHLWKELYKAPVESHHLENRPKSTFRSRPQSDVSCFSCVSESVSPRFMEVIGVLDRPKKNFGNAIEKIYENSDEKLITISENHFLKMSHFSKRALNEKLRQYTKLPTIDSSLKMQQMKETCLLLDNVNICSSHDTFEFESPKSKFELPSIKEERKGRRMPQLDAEHIGSNNFSGSSRKPKKQQQLIKSPTPSLDNNPLLTAERQLMDLLDDDFHPFKSSNIIENSPRPHTTANTPKPSKKLTNKSTQSAKTQSKISRYSPSNKKSIKNAENKSISAESSNRSSSRASVIEPPFDFDDAIQLDDFEFIENYINNAFDLESNSELITDDDKCSKNYLQSDYKYSDDSSIDPRLINENDNLDYPGSFTPSTLTPPLSDTETISSYKGGKSMLEPLVLAQTEYVKEDDDVDLDALLRDIDTLGKRFPKSKFSPAPKDDLCSVSLHSSFGISGANFNASESDRSKKLSSLKRSISLLDPVVPKAKPLKNKQEVNDFFMEQDQKQQLAMKHDEVYQKQIDSPSLEKKDQLFSVDDDLYEEYKRYEQMYLQEKEQQRLNALAYTNEEDLSSKKSSDSAYGRKPSKARSSRHAKLTPLEPLPYSPHVHPDPPPHFNRTNSASSSGSDMSSAAIIVPTAQSVPVPIPPTNITAPRSAINTSPQSVATNKRSISPPSKGGMKLPSPRQKQDMVDHRVSKFCHECGNKYPLNSAKFCVECGIKRLIL